MQILITGAAGFIGFHLAQKLLRVGSTVIAVDNLNHAYHPQFKIERLKILEKYPRFVSYETDILQPRSLIRIFKQHKIITIYHLAARTGVRTSIKYPALYQRTNVTGTKNLYELAYRFGVKHFLFASSSSVYGNSRVPFSEKTPLPKPVSPYAASKQQAEKELWQLQYHFRIPTTILRFFSVYGPHGRPDMAPYLFTEAILKNRPLTVFGDGQQARDYTYIDDIVLGLLKALYYKPDWDIVNLGNHQPVSIITLLQTIEKLTRKKAWVRFKRRRQEEVTITWADVSRAKKLLGWEPTTLLASGMERFIKWYTIHRL